MNRLLNRNAIVEIAFTDFLTGISSALDLLNPANGQRGIRRAFIAMSVLRLQGASPDVQQNIFIAALLYELGSKNTNGVSRCEKKLKSTPLIAKSAPLIFDKSGLHTHSRLLDLIDNFDLLALYEFPQGRYPAAAIETVCDSIGSRYSLDDVLALRELESNPEIWWKLSSPALFDDVRTSSPFTSQLLNENELVQLAGLLATIIDEHCQHAGPYSAKIAYYSVRLAHLYGFSPSGVNEMRLAGLLHGIGKLALPPKQLTRQSLLTADQQKQFKAYPLTTRKILSRIPGMYRTAMIASRQHEQPNGKGFPDALFGTQMDLSARMISAACAYVSLLVGCHSSRQCTSAEAIDVMKAKSAEGSLDYDVVEALEMIILHEGDTTAHKVQANALQENIW